MKRPPAPAFALLDDILRHIPRLMRHNLVGIYLYGSLTQSAFNPRRSDIDCVVVTHRNLTDPQFNRLNQWLAASAKSNPWTQRLQMSFLIRDQLLTMNAKACLYQFGQLKRCGSDGNPIIWLNILKSGTVLLGPPPETFVPQITPKILFAALLREVGYLKETLAEKSRSKWRNVPTYRIYAVLTLCRILYTHANGTIVSKPRAAAWAMNRVPGDWRRLIRAALAMDAGRSVILPLRRIRGFIDFVDDRIRG